MTRITLILYNSKGEVLLGVRDSVPMQLGRVLVKSVIQIGTAAAEAAAAANLRRK